MKSFFQEGPELANPFEEDFLLQAFLESRLTKEQYHDVRADLERFGGEVAGPLVSLAEKAERELPVHIPYDAWGRRIDDIRVSSAWEALHEVSAKEGIVALGYERPLGEWSRLYQFAKLYLFHPSSAFYSCPLAMTDGAAKILDLYGGSDLKASAFRHLTSRDPKQFWTSGQWMTERTGGSDVSDTSTLAKRAGKGFQLYGTKWFSSATTAQMALGLGRIEGAESGSRGLSLFYIPMRDDQGNLNSIVINRLKDKLGTKALPTAELELQGSQAQLVGVEGHGVKTVATMLNITRMYNSICSIAQMRRGLSLALSYSKKRKAFGKTLLQQPLHVSSLVAQSVKWAKGTALTFYLSELLGKEEVQVASEVESQLLRLFTPIAKLWTAKECVEVTSEVLECFGGAGYVEDTQIPVLLRNAQVFPIWEGTTNVLSLDVLRVLQKDPQVLQSLGLEIEKRLKTLGASSGPLALEAAKLKDWLGWASQQNEQVWQSQARKLSMSLGNLWSALLLGELAHKFPQNPRLHALYAWDCLQEQVWVKKEKSHLEFESQLVL